jgi:hypothetical protein
LQRFQEFRNESAKKEKNVSSEKLCELHLGKKEAAALLVST